MCKDTGGTERSGWKSDQRAEAEIIKSDPSTAYENESIIFPPQ